MNSLQKNLKEGDLIQTPLEALKKTFGYDSFRGNQEDVINHVISGQNAFVLMPTGGGKSLCYQVPALCLKGITVVVSPLIALMQDQVLSLQQLGIEAYAINSSVDAKEVFAIKNKIRKNEIDLLYIAPERLLTEEILTLLCEDGVEISLFAIDEAHCVSSWGHDFRPIYTKLTILEEVFKTVPRIALTATADEATRKDIIEKLHLQNAKKFSASFDRPNIKYAVAQSDGAKNQLLSFIKENHPNDSGIVYCNSRKKVEDIAKFLKEKKFDVLPYHAGMDQKKRQKNLEYFLLNESVIMVATIAFGMGIDKPDVRFVAHLNLPKNIESYYQETGRAGRDGLASNAFMCYSASDIAIQRSFIESSVMNENQKRIENQKLSSLIGFCEASSCRRQVLLNYFGEKIKICGNCDNCLDPQELFDATIAAQKAVSAAYRTEQRFGVAYLIDILLGNENDRIINFGHNNLSVFGVGKELTKAQWQSIFRQLIANGFFEVDIANYGGLKITKTGFDFLKNKAVLKLRELPKKQSKKQQKTEKKQAQMKDLSQDENEIFGALKIKRMEIAKKLNIAPYMVFHDKALISMVKLMPRNKAKMLEVEGVGEAKFEKFGKEFLKVLSQN